MRSAHRPRSSTRPRAKLGALVTDLDRTLLAPGGDPTPTARRALDQAREMGLAIVLVSGREYPRLRRLAQGYGRWDALVAENGAVIESPWGTTPRIVGRRVAADLLHRLDHHPEVQGAWGEVVFSLPRSSHDRLLRAIAGLPVHVIPNCDRLMVLPTGVTKQTGVRSALRRLGLAQWGYAAIGDAENDVEMLKGAALAGTVANARPEVRRVVEFVAHLPFERGVREFVEGPLRARVEAESAGSGISGEHHAPAPTPR
jgi:hydroxymethylpyrimidine pyrophosphatase-like HAD family hydrolase